MCCWHQIQNKHEDVEVNGIKYIFYLYCFQLIICQIDLQNTHILFQIVWGIRVVCELCILKFIIKTQGSTQPLSPLSVYRYICSSSFKLIITD